MTTANEEVLHGRIRDLEATLLIGSKSIRAVFHLSPRLADIFGLLLSQDVVPTETLTTRLNLVSDAKVAVHRLRRQMAPLGITIHSRNRVGYWISDEDKAILHGMLEAKAPVADDSDPGPNHPDN
jgi:hypothetical protein